MVSDLRAEIDQPKGVASLALKARAFAIDEAASTERILIMPLLTTEQVTEKLTGLPLWRICHKGG